MRKVNYTRKKIQAGFKGLAFRTDEEVLDPSYAVSSLNYTLRGGVLKSDLGIEAATGYYLNNVQLSHVYPAFPDGVKILNVFSYRRRATDGSYDDRVVVQTDENKLYYTKVFEVDSWHEIGGISFSGEACAVNYNYDGNDVLLLCSDANGLTVLNDTTVTVVNSALKFTSLAVHYERIYGTVNGKRNQVWFSDNFDPTDWVVSGTGAGYVTFADECGDVLSVVSFLGYLYVFREHGIFRLTAYGDQSEFSLKKVFIDTGMIYKATIAICGDKIIFLAEEGLFAFDGYDVTRLTADIPLISTKNTAVGAYHENRYYLACKINLGSYHTGVCVNNALLEYDVREKSLNVLAPLDVLRLYPFNVHHATDLFVVLRRGTVNRLGAVGGYGRIFGASTSKLYKSPVNNFGTDRLKTVREVTFKTKYALTLTVILDGVEHSFPLEGKNEPQTVFVGKNGREIGIKLTSTSQNAFVTPPVLTIDLI